MSNIKTVLLDWIYPGLSPQLKLQRSVDNYFLVDTNATFAPAPITFPTMTTDTNITERYRYDISGVMNDGEYTYAIYDPIHGVNIGTGIEWIYNDQWASVDVTVSSRLSAAGGLITLGVDLVKIMLRDSVTTLPIVGANIAVMNSAGTVTIALITTDANGVGAIYLDDGTYVLRIQKEGYTFPMGASISVVGDTTQTITGIPVIPPIIVLPGLQTVYGYFYKLNGDPDPTITITVVIPLQSLTPGQSALLSNNKITTQTDSNGFFQVQLLKGIKVRFVITNYGSKDSTITQDDTQTIQYYYNLY
jgi:hypothetical protein